MINKNGNNLAFNVIFQYFSMLFFNFSIFLCLERPVRGTIACVCLVNETQKTLKVNKMDGFSKYDNFIFELNGIRVWRADGVGKGIVTPYQDTIVRPQGPTDLL